MGQEGDDILSLPVPPPPNPAARRAAIDAAMRRFDGIEEAPAPRRRFLLAGWANSHRAAAGGLVTAALIAVVSIPAIQVAIRDNPAEVASDISVPEVRNEPSEPMAANEVLPATADAAATAVPEPVEAEAKAKAVDTSAVTANVGAVAAEERMEKAVAAPPAMMAAPPPPPPPPPPAPSVAQRAPAGPEAVASEDALVVTGSRIRRQNMDSASPVTVIDPEGDFLSRLQDAIRNNDREAVATMVALPLHVRINGERRTYRSAREIYSDYDLIFTPAVRVAATSLRPNTLRSRDRGRLRGNSRIWFGCGQVDCTSARSIRIREINP